MAAHNNAMHHFGLIVLFALILAPKAGQAQATPDGSFAKPFIVHSDLEHDRLPVGAFFRDERDFGHDMLKQKIWPLGAVHHPAPEVRRATPVEVPRAMPVEVRRAIQP